MNNTQGSVSVPLRQCLVMSVLYGDSHQLPAALFGLEVVRRIVLGVTGEELEKVLYSSTTDILLVFAMHIDINRVKVQLESLASWMGKPVHLQCVRPSAMDLKKSGVMGSIGPTPQAKGCHQVLEGDKALALPFFSGKDTPEYDEVNFGQWLFAVEGAQLTSSSSALHC